MRRLSHVRFNGVKNRKTVFRAVHGFAQFLKQLEGALVLSVLWNREMKVMTSHLKTLGYLDFNKLLIYSPQRFVSLAESELMAEASRVSEIRTEEYERSLGFSVAAHHPPLMRALARENMLRGSVFTKGYVLPPGPRFHVVTSTFRLSDFLSQRVHEIVSPQLPRIEESVGIHLRNTDRTTNIEAMKAKLASSLSRRGSPGVFLASDDEAAAAEFKRHFPKADFFQLKRPFSIQASAQNLHFGVGDEDAESQLYYAVADIYLLSRCRDFIPAHASKSQWRHLIRAMRTPWGRHLMSGVEQRAL